jgi:hypothetical protein
MKSISYLLLFLITVMPSFASNLILELESTLSRDSLTVGDPFELVISAHAATDLELDWSAAIQGNLAPFVLLNQNVSVEDSSAISKKVELHLELALYETGELYTPDISVAWQRDGEHGVLQADSLLVTVFSVIQNEVGGQQAQPLDIIDPLDLKHSLLYWLIRLGIVLICLVLAYSGWRLLRNRKSGVQASKIVEVKLSPWEIWSTEIKNVELNSRWKNGETVEYYSELSLAIRGFLEDCLLQPFREMTLPEVERAIYNSVLDDILQKDLIRLLAENDLIKYARQWPDDNRNLTIITEYKTWVDNAREVLERKFASLQNPQENSFDPDSAETDADNLATIIAKSEGAV